MTTGVYYRREDYAGMARRLIIDLVDVPVAVMLPAAVVVAASTLAPNLATPGIILLLGTAVWFSYFVLLKRSNIRTAGYRLAGARIVNLQGERPGILCLVVRICFTVAGPLNF